MAKASKSAEDFVFSLESKLRDFEFPDDFVLDIWDTVHKN